MNIHASFPSKYVKAVDLAGRQPVVVIRSVEQALTWLKGQQVTKLVVYFVGKEKGLLLNKTNATTIAQLLGSEETDAWRGRSIRLYGTTTTFGGATVACVRVKAADVIRWAEILVTP